MNCKDKDERIKELTEVVVALQKSLEQLETDMEDLRRWVGQIEGRYLSDEEHY